jgi:predicted dehydrogenase
VTSKLGVGVVGVNPRIRRSILAGLAGSKRGRVAAICSRDPEKAATTAAEYGAAAYSSLAELLTDSSVDVVFIATPHALHYPMALAALQAGKRVIGEKPLTLTLDEATCLAAVSRDSGLPTVVNFTYHSLTGHRLVARLLSEGAIGRLRHLDLTYLQARQALPGANPSDAILDVGSHQIDLGLWWCEAGDGGEIATVASQVEPDPSGDTPIWTAIARTTTGAHVCWQADRVAAGSRNGMHCRLVGTQGTVTLTFDTDVVDVQVARFGDGSPEGSFRSVTIPSDLAVSYRDFPAFHVDRLLAALDGAGDFPDFAYGLKVQRVIDAVQRAAAGQCWVTL